MGNALHVSVNRYLHVRHSQLITLRADRGRTLTDVWAQLIRR
jgi:hypothetical protein